MKFRLNEVYITYPSEYDISFDVPFDEILEWMLGYTGDKESLIELIKGYYGNEFTNQYTNSDDIIEDFIFNFDINDTNNEYQEFINWVRDCFIDAYEGKAEEEIASAEQEANETELNNQEIWNQHYKW